MPDQSEQMGQRAKNILKTWEKDCPELRCMSGSQEGQTESTSNPQKHS